MESKDIVINMTTSMVMLMVAVSAVLIWKRQSGGMLRWIGMGCLAWVVSVAVKSAIALLGNEFILNLLKEILGNVGYIILGALWLGLLTGFTEIPIGFYIAKNRKYQTFKQGSGYGLGFGVFEAGALALGFAGLVLTETFAPGNLPDEVLNLIRDISWDTVATANIERLFAIAIHMATGILIIYSLATKRMIALWVAIIYKTMVDGMAGVLHLSGVINDWSPWFIIAAFFPFAVAGMVMILFVRKKWPPVVRETQAV